MKFRLILSGLGLVGLLAAQNSAVDKSQDGWPKADQSKPGEYVVEPGTRVPLSLINSISTKQAAEGDRVYMESVFPILVKSRIVIPPGSYVAGTVTQVKRPGRMRGRGELYVRFDSITLPNGVTRDFRARIGGLDGRASEELDRSEGKINSEGNKTGDAQTVGEATAAGASAQTRRCPRRHPRSSCSRPSPRSRDDRLPRDPPRPAGRRAVCRH